MTGELDPRLSKALGAAELSPEDEALWDELEELAESLERPDEVGALYRSVLAGSLPPPLAERLGRRALGFHEEWFGDESPHLVEVLTRILDVDPRADWALQRATVVLTIRERWGDLLGLYDRALRAATEDWRRIALLEEASQLAKDFAHESDRAIDYQKQLLALRPSDAQLVASLERLLEKQGRWQELIELWRKRVADGDDEARTLRERIAEAYLDHQKDAESALEACRELLEQGHSIAHAVALLERILALASASADARRGALGLLREQYEREGRGADVERVLTLALEFSTREETISIRRNLGQRSSARGENLESMEHWAQLLLLDPFAEDAKQRLDALGNEAGEHAKHADALIAAADATRDAARHTELLLDAGDVLHGRLGDRERAEAVYRRVLDASASEDVHRTAARRIVTLLETPSRAPDRLDVLERLAPIENEPSEKRRVLGEAARLAETLAQFDRALALWQTRLDSDPRDLEALDARIEILERIEQWPTLIQTLRLRANSHVPAPLQRADLVRLAGIAEERVGDRPLAIGTWLEVQDRFGEAVDIVDALFRLFSAEERWQEMASMLERAVHRDEARAADIVVRLADVRRERLGEPLRAANGYHQALKLDPRHVSARKGLMALIESPETKGAAVEGLAEAALRTDDHEALLDLLEHRLEAASAPRVRVRLLREAAELEEQRRKAPWAALSAMCRAFLIVPEDEAIEREILRLATDAQQAVNTDSEDAGETIWRDVVATLRQAIALSASDVARAAQLHRRTASILEVQLEDLPTALDALLSALALEPRHATTPHDILRIATQLGGKDPIAWRAVATAFVTSTRAHDEIDSQFLDDLEAAADKVSAWDALATSAMEAMPSEGESRLGELGRLLETRIAIWHRDRRGDLSAAEAALARALRHQPGHEETLRELARLEWREPNRALISTLLSLAERLEDDLDALYDAARIALDPVGDIPLAKQILGKLFRESIRLWERGNRTRGERPADKTALWAQDELIRIELEAGHTKEAIDLLSEGARLPVSAAESRGMRRRAGDLAREVLGDENRAMKFYQSIVDESLEDGETVDRLAMMYEKRGRIPELLALRQRELEEPLASERRLAVRLEVARLLGRLESAGGRIDMLRENLADEPGHDASIEEVFTVLTAKGQHGELADLLTAQARKVEDTDAVRGGRLWGMVARLAEAQLHEGERAVAAYRRVVALDVTAEALEALARLYLERGEPAQAAEWLEKRMELAKGAERTPFALRLAEARLAAGRTDRAILALERALAEDPKAKAPREQLAELYRRTEAWSPLAKHLSDGVLHSEDEATQLAYVREAATLYRDRLRRPDLAIPILERGVRLAPEDQELRATLAAGLRVAGRLDEARTILDKLASEFGRRRSPERAAIHFQLAEVAHAGGDLKEALEQLDKASSMDLGHPNILKMLGDLAREAGQLERSERAYRALLLLIRRQTGDGGELSVGVSEVLYELSRLAAERNQSDQANELLESAFEAATHSSNEAARLTRILIHRGATDLALRVVEMRLNASSDSAERARALIDHAEIFERLLERPKDALQARLSALDLSPTRGESDVARELAVKIGEVALFVERVRALTERMQGQESSEIISDLLFSIAEVTERELRDLDAATSLYQRVEELGARTLDAWRALARIASTRGDHVEEIRVLRRLVAAGVDTSDMGQGEDIPESAKVEAFYRIAEVELADAETLESGVATLAEALGKAPDHARAARILSAGARKWPERDALMALYERAARGAQEPEILLEFIEIRTRREDSSLDEIREGVELASRLEAHDRAEELLRRGVELARATLDGIGGHLWLPNALAEQRMAKGDVKGAVEWRKVAAEASESSGEPTTTRSLYCELAKTAQMPGGDLELSASIYRRLLDADPSDQTLWAPLADVYARMQDRIGFEEAVAQIIDGLIDASARNEMRMVYATFLFDVAKAEPDGIEVLRAVLDEDPDHLGASKLLADIFERDGRQEELTELLERQLDRARDRREVAAISALTLRMGGLLEGARKREQATDLYRQGLEWAPSDPALLRALLAVIGADAEPRERAALSEQLLAVSEGDDAAKLALELAEIYAGEDDAEGVGRVLDLGFRACPSSDVLRARLEAWYGERDDLGGLADTIAYDASHRSDPGEAVARFREAATLLTQRLDRPDEAVEILRKARSLAPSDLALLGELVSAQLACNRPEDAADDVGAALEAHGEPNAARAYLLRLRASLLSARGETDGAITDLEEAFAIDPAATQGELLEVLDRRRFEVDRTRERELTLRLAELLQQVGEGERSRDLLAEWSDRDPEDREVLRTLRAIDTIKGRFEDLVRHCSRLVEVEEGEAQVEAALALIDAASRIGRPEEARAGLERAHRDQPSEARVRDALRAMYEASHAWNELTTILLADAAGTTDVNVQFEALRRAGELLLYEVGDPGRAFEPLRQALTIKEDDPDVLVLYADAMIGSGALAEAVELLQNAITSSRRKRSPALAAMQLRMARIAGISGDQQTQLEWLKVALESDKNNGVIAAELAELAMILGDDAAAMNALRVVTLQKTPGPMSKAMAFLRQAQIAHRSGDHQKAVLWARRARIEDGDLNEAADFLRSIGDS